MNNDEIKNFAINLAKCETEDDVITLLKKYSFWDDDSCWRYFGDIENNYSTIGNQQASSDSALVEKVINSIDAVIMGDLLSKGINPSSESAPKSIEDYLHKYKNISEGKLSLLDSKTRSELSKDILLVSTKNPKSNYPNYSIIDNGEGQTPNSMPETILSISKSNKMRVGAVQGKFNMGGTGVLAFSGNHKFEIIISRKRQDIPSNLINDNSYDKWSVTIVRKEFPRDNMKSSYYRYLAPNGELLSFDATSLPLKPIYNTKQAIPYKEEMYWGTFIKIFDYNIKGANKVSTIHLHDRLSLLMPGIALPVKIIETRSGEAKSNKTLYGLTARLEENQTDALEITPIGLNGKINGEDIKANIYVFKSNRGESYKKNEGVLYTMNGQCQGFETKIFFNKMNLSYLADSLLVIVDCSNLSSKTTEDLFLNSRDRLKKGKVREDLISFLEDNIKNISELKSLNSQRRSEKINEKVSDSKTICNVVENVLLKSKTLSNILIEGKDISSLINTRKPHLHCNPPVLNKFPTYFKFAKKNRRTAEINRKARITFDTDAENNYFTRDNLPGTSTLKVNNETVTDSSLNILNGVATLNININPNMFEIGKIYTFELIITDDSRAFPLISNFELQIIEKSNTSSSPKPPGISGPKKDNLKSIPKIHTIRRNEWSNFNFDEFSAIKIIKNDDSYDFICNLENKYLLNEIALSKNDTQSLENIFTTSLVVYSMSIIASLSKENKKDSTTIIDIESTVYDVTKAIAPAIVPTLKELIELSQL